MNPPLIRYFEAVETIVKQRVLEKSFVAPKSTDRVDEYATRLLLPNWFHEQQMCTVGLSKVT